MSIGNAAGAEQSISEQWAPEKPRKPPRRRKITAKSDWVQTPEPR